MSNYKYDVAFSFAGEQRGYVKDVYDYLTLKGVKVFYDQDEAVDAETWGQNLVDYFNDIFRHKAKFCIVFISQEYANKIWTNYERQVIQARGLVDQGYILPARFDGTKLAGEIETTKYVNLAHLTPEDFGNIILRKIQSKSAPDTPPAITFRTPRIPKAFNPYTEREVWVKTITDEVTRRCEVLSEPSVECSHFQHGEKDSLRIVINGKTIYAFDIHRGSNGTDDEGLVFSHAQGRSSVGGGVHAMGTLKWDKDTGAVVIKLLDLSLFDTMSTDTNYTLESFIDKLWDKIVNLIEAQYEER